MTGPMRAAAVRARGFTLLEVMIGLALLGLGLVVLIKSTSGNIMAAKRAQMIGVVTELSRGKMYDIEEKLLKEGFTETDQSEDGRTFDEEGWPEIKYSYKVEQVELPSFDQLQALAAGAAAGSGARGSGEDGEDGELGGSFQDSALGSMISMFGGGFAGGSEDIDAKGGAAFIQGYYQMIQETLKVCIRKVTLTVKYDVLGEENELTTVVFFTDAVAMEKGILGAVPDGGGEETGGTGGTGGTTGGGAGGGGTRTPSPNPSGGRGGR